MEEVVSSNLTRSTKTFQTLTLPLVTENVVAGVQVESKNGLRRVDLAAGVSPPVTLALLHRQCDRQPPPRP